MPRRVNNKRKLKRARHNGAADHRDTRRSIPASLKTTRGISRGPRKFLSQHDKRKDAKKIGPLVPRGMGQSEIRRRNWKPPHSDLSIFTISPPLPMSASAGPAESRKPI